MVGGCTCCAIDITLELVELREVFMNTLGFLSLRFCWVKQCVAPGLIERMTLTFCFGAAGYSSVVTR